MARSRPTAPRRHPVSGPHRSSEAATSAARGDAAKAAQPALPRVTLEQWRALVAVVEAGGHAQAAAQLHKSQSSITAAIHKLQDTLELRAFEVQGRKAVLTPAGQMLYQRARALLEDAGGLEHAARRASAGWETEITLAVEVLFPTWLMLRCLARFGAESPQTRIEWLETVIDGTQEALLDGIAQLGIAPVVPASMSGEPLMPVRFVPVAHPEHPLHRLGRELSVRDLRRHRHLVVRDTALRRDRGKTSVDAAQRWTVGAMATSIGAASRGLGFAWFPEDKIRQELAAGQLKVLPLQGGRERSAQLHLIIPDPDVAGPGTRRLAAIIREEVARDCRERGHGATAGRGALNGQRAAGACAGANIERMYTLYIANKNYSSWSLRPWSLLTTLGIAFDEQLVPFGEPDFGRIRAISPTGKVPCLVDGGTVVWDSLAIVEYLAERHAGVWPADPLARAWARSAAAEMHSGFGALRNDCSMCVGVRIALHRVGDGLRRDLARIDELWSEGLARFGGPMLAGAAFTAVDAFFVPVAFRVRSYGLELGAPAAAYARRLLELPSTRQWEAAALRETWRDAGHEDEILAAGRLLEDQRAKPG